MEGLTIVPANETSWEDLEAIVGRARWLDTRCFCQKFKIGAREWNQYGEEGRAFALREQTDCGYGDSGATTGLVAYLEGEPAGWCAVEPRSAYFRLGRVPWAGRTEDRSDDSVWAVTCFVIRTEFRRQGLMRELLSAAVTYARENGAKVVEGYPMITEPGVDITWGELHVGSRNAFVDEGFEEVTHPTKRRYVMRIEC